MATQYRYDKEKKTWVKVTTSTPSRGETNRSGRSGSTTKSGTTAKTTSAPSKTVSPSPTASKTTPKTSSSSRTYSRGETNRGSTTSTPRYNTYSSESKSYSYSPKNSSTTYSTPSYKARKSFGSSAQKIIDTLEKGWSEWWEYTQKQSSEESKSERGSFARAGMHDLNTIDVEDTRRKVYEAAWQPGAKDNMAFTKFQAGKAATNADLWSNNLRAGIDALEGLTWREKRQLSQEAERKTNETKDIYALARIREGDMSAVDELTGKAYTEGLRMANLYGYDVTSDVMKQQLPKDMQKAGVSPVDIPADYDMHRLDEDRFMYLFKEKIDGGAATDQEWQEAKQRLEMVLGIEDADDVKDWSAISFDQDYLKDMQTLNRGSETYQDVLDKTSQYDNSKVAEDILVLRDYYEGHVPRSTDEVQRAANRVYAATGVDVTNAENFEAAFDQAMQTNEALRDAVVQAVYKESGKMPVGAELDMDNYLTYMQAYMQQQNNANRAEAEQAQFDDQIQQKYGEYRNAPDFASKSQPVSMDIVPTNEAEAIHEAIVAIDDPEVFDRLVDDKSGMPSSAQQKYTADTITPEQREMFNYLWDPADPSAAMQYLEDIDWSVRKAIAAKTEDVSEQLSEGLGGGAASSLASVLMSPARAAVAPVNAIRTATGQEIDQYDPTFNVGRSSDMIRGNVGQNLDELLNGANIFGWNIGSGIYQGAMSIADSWMTAPLGASAGAAVMGLEAADTAMRTALEKGRTQEEALRDAAVTAGIESLAEKMPLENLFGDVGNPGKYIISNALSEMGEEVASEGLNMIYDTLAYGDESDLGQLRNELITKGYAGVDLTLGMLKEVAGRFRDAAFGGAAGGFVGAAPRGAMTAAGDRSAGKNMQANNSARSMLDLAEKMLPSGDVKSIASEQLKALDGEGKVSNSKLGRVYRELLANIDEQTRQILDGTMLRNVREQLREFGVNDGNLAEAVTRVVAGDGSASAEDYAAVGANDAAMNITKSLTAQVNEARGLVDKAGELVKNAGKQAKAEKTAQTSKAAAKEAVVDNASDDEVIELPDDALEGMNLSENEVSTTSDGEEVSIVGAESVGTDGELMFKVQNADGEQKTVKASEVAVGTNDDASARLAVYAKEYGASAASMFNARTANQDVDEYAAAFKKAVQYGSDGRNIDTVSGYDSLSVLNQNQIGIAYELGRAERISRSELSRQSMTEKLTAFGPVKVGNVDVSQIKSVNSLNKHQKRSIVTMRNVAELLGINVEFTESVANEQGRYSGAHGSWNPKTLTLSLDIHAGSNYASDINYAMMHTAGHELTHEIFQFADSDVKNAYQEYVLGSLSQKMTADELDAKIAEYIGMPGVKDRDAAIEEIVAEASVEALSRMTESDIRALADENPSLVKRIANSISRWVSNMKRKIAKAFSGTEAKNEYAKLLNDQMDELAGKWNAALLNATRNKNEILRNAETRQRPTRGTAQYADGDGEVDDLNYEVTDTDFFADDADAQATKKQSTQDGLLLEKNHIDQRTPESIRGADTTLFCSEVEEAQVGFAAAANMLLYDAENSVRGQKFFTGDGEVTGQTRMTSPLLEKIKDSTGWTWDKIINSLRQFAAMETGDTMPKNTVTNREMELYLDEVLSAGYTTLDGQRVSPWSEYIEAKNGYQGGNGMTAPKSAYQNAIDFAEYAFAGDFADDIKYSLRDYTPQQKENWAASKRIVLYSNKTQALQFIEDALSGKNLEKKLYFGRVPSALAQRIAAEANYDNDLTGYNVCIHAKEIRKINKKHGNEKSEALRGQRAIVADDYVRIPDTIEKADVIRISDENYNGSDALIFEKTYEGSRTTIVAVVGSGKLDLYVQTMYASTKKRSLADAASASAPAITSKTTYGTASANSIAENDDGVKFSMREPVERTKDLIAVHNIREDNLRKALDLGGFPMPSIAVAKRDIGHQNFGGISLVFGSATIDPKANKRNKVYSADAWTPTFPQVEYEVDAKADARIYNKLTELKRKVDPYFADDLSRMMYGVEDQLNRNGGEEGLVKRALDNYGMKAAYLESIGEHANVEKKTVSEERKYTEHQIGIYKQIADLVGLDNIRSMPMSEIYSQYGDAINDIYPGASNSKMRFMRVIGNVNEYFKSIDSAPVQKEVDDPVATREAIDAKIDPNAYERWVRDMYSGIVRGSGVYNGKEMFTPSGNRRSFTATHYPATVEGIAKAMYDAHGGKVKNISANHDAKSLRAVTAKSFKSIDEMHANVGRLKARTQEEADALTSSLDKRLADLAGVVLETKPRSRDAYESLMAHDQVVAILQEVAEKKYSAATIKTAYAGYGYNITGDTAKELKVLLDDISVMPVNIFEAKPERAVYFDEVKYAIVPDTMNADLRRRLEELVPDVREYTDGDEAQRLELLNAREDLLFQLRDPNQISDRELLANVMDSAATNAAELDFVRRYRGKIEELNQKQAEYEQARQDVADARKNGARKSDIAVLENKAKILGNQLDRMDGQLLKFEAGKPLQAVVKRQREELRQKANERMKKRVAEVRQQESAKRDELRNRMSQLRSEKNAKIEELKKLKTQKVEEMRDQKNESFARQKYLAEVKAGADKLREMVTHPTNKKHVPEILRKPMADFLDAFDYTSKRQLEGGDPTKADLRMANAYAEMKDAIQRMKNQQSGIETTGAEYFSGYLDLPSSYIEEFDNIMKNVRAAIEASGNISETPINLMKSNDLHELAKLLRILHTSINQMNKNLANAKYATADAAANDSMADLGEVEMGKERNKLFGKVMDFIDWKNTTPYYAFERFGRGGKAIFESLMNGWDKLAFNAQELVDFTKSVYKPSEVAEWERDIKDVKLSSGETVRMSAAQLMSVYCLAKREQAVGHLMGGGIRVADVEGKRGKMISQTANYTLLEEDIEAMRSLLTEHQREVADKLQADMVERGADWGNEVSMKRFGYKMFTEPNYFPVESDKNNMKAKDEAAQENSLLRLLNMSATKDLTKGANNAIVIRGIFDVYTSHMSDMAKYNALGLQILDAMKWLNYVERTEEVDKNGRSTGKITTRSVQKSLESAYGTEARRYIMEFIRNLNGDVEAGLEDGIFNKMASNYKIAAVGANLRVGLLQITSMPRAATVIDPKYLMAGLAKWNKRGGKTSTQAIDKVGIAKWKSMGFYDTNISRNLRQMIKNDEAVIDKVREGSMKLAEWGDAWTMGVLYGAVESELLHTKKNLAPGTEAWDKRVNERMREIIYRTQVVDSTMTRSHLMRQKGEASGVLAFMSEPTLALNMVNDALFKARMDARRGVKWNPATAKTVAKVMAVSATVNVFAAAIEALFSALRDDDEFEEFSEKYMDALIGDYSDAETYGERLSAFMSSSFGSKLNPLDNIPVVSDIVDAWKNGTAEQMWQAFAGEIGEGYRALMKVLREGGSTADYYRAVYKFMGGVSKAVGIPISNAMRDLASIYNTAIAEPMGWKRLQTYDNTEGEAADAILEAMIAGDDDKVKKIRERVAVYGMDEAKIEKGIATRVTDAYKKGDVTKDFADKLLVEEGGKRSREAGEALTKADYEIATGLKYSDMKEDFIAGTISEKQLREHLKKYDGLRDDEIDDKISEWKYDKDTGMLYSEMKLDYIDGELTDSEVLKYRTKYGGVDQDSAEETLGHWKYEKDTGLAWDDLRDDYIDGVISESELRDYLKVYGSKDEEGVETTVLKYDYYAAYGTDDGYSKHWRIPYAYETGGDYGAYIDEAFQKYMYGGTKENSWKTARNWLASSLASFYKPRYLPIAGTPEGDVLLEEILDVFVAAGWERSYQRQYIAEKWFE